MVRKAKRTFETEKEPFPTTLRKELDDNNISQLTLSKKVGIARQTISLYCTGQSYPDTNTLSKIADFFDVSTDYLLGRTKVKSKKIEMRSICDYTGLSEKALYKLIVFSRHCNALFNECVSEIIANDYFYKFIESIIKTIELEQWISEDFEGAKLYTNNMEEIYRDGVDYAPSYFEINLSDVARHQTEVFTRLLIEDTINNVTKISRNKYAESYKKTHEMNESLNRLNNKIRSIVQQNKDSDNETMKKLQSFIENNIDIKELLYYFKKRFENNAPPKEEKDSQGDQTK